jgi:DNA-binding NarL/FixJ family response regulator
MVIASAPSPSPPRINVLIVDQHLAFRDALGARLQVEQDLAVVAKVHSAESASRVLVGRSADVILLDAELPGNSALAFCAETSRRVDAPRIVMLSAASRAERIVAAVRAGAVAWVRKDESVDHLIHVIRGVVRGETWVPPSELGLVLRLLIDDQDDRRDCDDLLAALTAREREVLFLLVEGAGPKEVAERLRLSANTVRTHLQSLMAKLGVHSTLEAVALTRPKLEALPEIRELLRSTSSVEGTPAGSISVRTNSGRRAILPGTPTWVGSAGSGRGASRHGVSGSGGRMRVANSR